MGKSLSLGKRKREEDEGCVSKRQRTSSGVPKRTPTPEHEGDQVVPGAVGL